MNALIAVIGTAILGWVWLIVYNYTRGGFEDLFLLGSFAAATLHFPTYDADKSVRNFFVARAHELKQCTCIVVACIAIGLMMIAPDGGIPDITWQAIEQIAITSIGSVVIVHTIGRLLWRV